ncbi:MAG: T9SS type A sorting domain-containing protein [Bacteroidota bacterium]
MRKNLLFSTIFLLSLLFTGAVKAQTTQGTPDAYGYRWNTAEYSWVDISATGTRVDGLGDDNLSGAADIGFSFPFYWNHYSTCYIGSNGYIMFNQQVNIASGQVGFNAIPKKNDGYSNFIAPLLSDLTFVTNPGLPVPGATIYYETRGQQFIVSYVGVPFWNRDSGVDQISGSNTFQIILNGADSTITFQYQNMNGPTYSGYAQPIQAGIESLNEIGVGSRPSATSRVLPANNSAVVFKPIVNSAYFVKDVATSWMMNTDNGGFFKWKDLPLPVKTMVSNTGTVNINSRVTIILALKDETGATIPLGAAGTKYLAADTSSVHPTLRRNQDSLVVFDNVDLQSLASATGLYSLKVTSTTGSDASASNNVVTERMVVVDSAQQEIVCNYASADMTTWDLFLGPVGLYIEPPFYPAKVKELEFYAAWPSDPTNFDSVQTLRPALYKGGAIPGPATLVKQWDLTAGDQFVVDTIGPAGAFFLVKHRVPLDSNYTITSGGVYIGLGASPIQTQLAYNAYLSDNVLPHSRRTYEVTGGVWGSHRNRDSVDFAAGLVLVAPDTVIIQGNKPVIAKNTQVDQNYPNPAVATTTIPYFSSRDGEVTLVLHNSVGQAVFTRNLGVKPSGKNNIPVDITALPAGYYTYSVSTPDGTFTRRLIKQ